MKEDKIFLKEWVQPMAELHALTVVEDILGIEQDDPDYKKEFEKAFYEFCKEFYENSLIPHAANPTVPAGKNVFEVFKPDFMSGLNAESEDIKGELYFQITRSISMISRVLVQSEMGKLKYDLKDVVGEKDEKTKIFHDSVRNRYKRMVFNCILMGHIKAMFKLKKGEVDRFVDSLLGSEKWRSLQSTKATKDFAEKIKIAVASDMKDYDPLMSVRIQFEKK